MSEGTKDKAYLPVVWVVQLPGSHRVLYVHDKQGGGPVTVALKPDESLSVTKGHCGTALSAAKVRDEALAAQAERVRELEEALLWVATELRPFASDGGPREAALDAALKALRPAKEAK